MQCCQVAVFMYSPIDFSGFQHCLGGGGGLQKIYNDGTAREGGGGVLPYMGYIDMGVLPYMGYIGMVFQLFWS